jgi:hypothetical protein
MSDIGHVPRRWRCGKTELIKVVICCQMCLFGWRHFTCLSVARLCNVDM